MPHIHHTHVHGSVEADFYCGYCGYEAVAIVDASGMASGGSRDERHDEATADMNANAFRLANCAPCPACRRTNSRHIMRLKVRAWTIASLIPLGLTLVTWPFVGGTDSTTFAALGIVAGGLFVIGALPVFFILRSKWWANATERVHFS